MINEVFHDSEDRFCDENSCIAGMAKFNVEWIEDFSADIGGIDGHYCVATMINLTVGGREFTADEIAEMFGARAVYAFEQWVAEYETENN
jgi:hypothetical protein